MKVSKILCYDVIIYSRRGPCGFTAALYALRANKSVLIIEKSAFGGQMTLSPKIENYPGFEALSGVELADKMTEQVLNKGAEVELAEVKEIIDGDIKKVITGYGEFEAKAVIIATGVKHRRLGLEKEESFIGRGVYYCAVCDGGYFCGKEVILIGGGNSALQEAVLLADICKKVTIVQNLADFTGEAKMADAVRFKKDRRSIVQTGVDQSIGDEDFMVRRSKIPTRRYNRADSDGMVLAIDLLPNTSG